MIKVKVVAARIASPKVFEERMEKALEELDGRIDKMYMMSDDRTMICTILYKEEEAKKAAKKVVRKAPAKTTEA